MAALSLEEEETHGDFHGCRSHCQVLSRRTYGRRAIAEDLNARCVPMPPNIVVFENRDQTLQF
jgi:hypothetical protein